MALSGFTRDGGGNRSGLLPVLLDPLVPGLHTRKIMNSINLTLEQAEILDFAKSGHNLVVTGRAGTGKSFVISQIISSFRKIGRKCSVVCSSGVSCTVYEVGLASTVHSYYGLQTAELPWQQVVQRSIQNNLVKERINSAECIIWDEASMSSRRLLELVNFLHYSVACEDEKNVAFGGKQVIIVGDFLQLRPVPSDLDAGDFMFTSPVFRAAFPHRFEMTHVKRQGEDEVLFLQALTELRMGECSSNAENFLQSLSKPLDNGKEHSAVHIFFKKLPAQLHNLNALRALPGDLLRFEATCEGTFADSTRGCPVEKVLLLKLNCKVMLLWNLSQTLKNGSQGTFIGIEGDSLLVRFDKEGVVRIRKEVWIKRNRENQVVGTIRQYPLGLCYAITCHKSQGLTLEAAIIHCSREFVSGLTYVACSRVKSAANLQLINFKPFFLLPPSRTLIDQCKTNIGTVQEMGMSCCRRKKLRASYFQVDEVFQDLDSDASEEHFPLEVCDRLVQNYFEKDANSENAEDLACVLERINQDESAFSSPPEPLETDKLLQSLVADTEGYTLTPREEAKVKLLNDIDHTTLMPFLSIIWYHCYLLFRKFLLNNQDEVVVISRQSFTASTAELHEFTRSEEYVNYVHQLFNGTELTQEQTTLAFQITLKIYSAFLENMCAKLFHMRAEEVLNFSVCDMPLMGQAKVRHVGGWVIHKLLQGSRTYIKNNMFSLYKETQAAVQAHVSMCNMIEECCIEPYSTLEHTTAYSGTLDVTEVRQYRERGLTHISDQMFEFFLMLEQKRVDLINEQKLLSSKEDMVCDAKKQLLDDNGLKMKWASNFQNYLMQAHANEPEHINTLYTKAIGHYVNMGASQFLRDYRRAHSIKKSMELRKKVLEKQKKEAEKQESVPFQEIQKDRSRQKVESHGRLANFVRKHEWNGLKRVYTKPQLLALIRAYRGQPRSRCNKTSLAKEIQERITSASCISQPLMVDDRQYAATPVAANGIRICLRLVPQ